MKVKWTGIHTGFSAKGGGQGGRVGWAAIVKDQIEIVANFKNFFRCLGGGDPMFGGGYPRAPPLLYESLVDHVGKLQNLASFPVPLFWCEKVP